MDIREIRLKNLKRLIEEAGGRPADLCRVTGITDGHLSAVLSKKKLASGTPRGLGTKTARNLERKMGKPEGWMDTLHDQDNGQPGTVERRYMGSAMDPEIKAGDTLIINPSIPLEALGVKIAAFETARGLQVGRSSPGQRTLLYTPSSEDPIDITDQNPEYIGCVTGVKRLY